jgi:apolipoprotein N-acyltransferase
MNLERDKGARVSLGLAICFEDTDSAQMRRLAAMGAEALVFITNDSWFSHSHEAEQHAWQSIARAIETGLPVVRVGNSGVTGTITPQGKPSWLVGGDGKVLVDRGGTMFDRVVPCGNPTVYVRLGDIPLGVSFLAVLVFGLFCPGVFRKNYRQ